MLSRRCRIKNEITIPRIFRQRAIMSSANDTIDMSTAENWLMRHELIDAFTTPRALEPLSEKVRKQALEQAKNACHLESRRRLFGVRIFRMQRALADPRQPEPLWLIFSTTASSPRSQFSRLISSWPQAGAVRLMPSSSRFAIQVIECCWELHTGPVWTFRSQYRTKPLFCPWISQANAPWTDPVSTTTIGR